jgi:excisionase family DNA binding protein
MAKPKRRLPPPSSLVVTVSQAATLLHVSESTVIRAIRAGLLPSFALARRRLVPRDALLSHAFRQLPVTLPGPGGAAGGQTARLSRQEAADEGDA